MRRWAFVIFIIFIKEASHKKALLRRRLLIIEELKSQSSKHHVHIYCSIFILKKGPEGDDASRVVGRARASFDKEENESKTTFQVVRTPQRNPSTKQMQSWMSDYLL